MRQIQFALIPLLIALAACTAAPVMSSAAQSVETFCADNCDCPYGAYCASHVCVGDFGPFAPCYCAARDCSDGSPVCSNTNGGGGFCVSSCTTDCECSPGTNCQNGVCEADFSPLPQCSCTIRDCADGQTCSGGFCTTGGGGGGTGGGGTGGGGTSPGGTQR